MNEKLHKFYCNKVMPARQEVASKAIRYIHCEEKQAPKLIIENEKRMLIEAVGKYDLVYNEYVQKERALAQKLGIYSCEHCDYHKKNGYCEMYNTIRTEVCEWWLNGDL